MSRLCSSFSSIRSRFSKSGTRKPEHVLQNHIEISTRVGPNFGQRKIILVHRLRKPNSSAHDTWIISTLLNAVYFYNHSERSKQSNPGAHNPSPSYQPHQKHNALFQSRRYTVSTAPTDENEVMLSREPLEKQRSKEELLKLVDYYDKNDIIEQPPYPECGKLHEPTNPSSLQNPNDQSEWPATYTPPADRETKKKLRDLNIVLTMDSTNLDQIYQLYRSLPETRICYLDSSTRHKLLHVLSVVEYKDEHSMLRYLSVVDDLKASNIPLSLSEWNSAISFVARYVRKTTAEEVEAALCMWREMEYTAGIRGDNVTFNILFDAAYKAGKFTLAEMIFAEMDARRLSYTRYHYVTSIMYHGARQDGDGVRAAYRKLIEAGEIVDTLVLNAMMSALIRAREPNSAENLYLRMKQAHLAQADPPRSPQHFESRREANKALMRVTLLTVGDKKKRDELQRRSIIAPDIITYLILVEYFCVMAGDLEKTAVFLEEMKWFALPAHGAIFVKIFKGFYSHGGMKYTSWTGARLELVYKSFIMALDLKEANLFISWGIAFWILKAFGKCRGPSRALSVWEDLRMKWEPNPTDLGHLASVLNCLIEQDLVQKRGASPNAQY